MAESYSMKPLVVRLALPGREEWTLHGRFRTPGQAKYEAWMVYNHGGYRALYGYASKRIFMSYAKVTPQ